MIHRDQMCQLRVWFITKLFYLNRIKGKCCERWKIREKYLKWKTEKNEKKKSRKRRKFSWSVITKDLNYLCGCQLYPYYVDWIRYWKWVAIFTVISLDDGSAAFKSTCRDYSIFIAIVTNGLVSHLPRSPRFCVAKQNWNSPTVWDKFFHLLPLEPLQWFPVKTGRRKLMSQHVDFFNVNIDLWSTSISQRE